jgi:hypothetical protein
VGIFASLLPLGRNTNSLPDFSDNRSGRTFQVSAGRYQKSVPEAVGEPAEAVGEPVAGAVQREYQEEMEQPQEAREPGLTEPAVPEYPAVPEAAPGIAVRMAGMADLETRRIEPSSPPKSPYTEESEPSSPPIESPRESSVAKTGLSVEPEVAEKEVAEKEEVVEKEGLQAIKEAPTLYDYNLPKQEAAKVQDEGARPGDFTMSLLDKGESKEEPGHKPQEAQAEKPPVEESAQVSARPKVVPWLFPTVGNIPQIKMGEGSSAGSQEEEDYLDINPDDSQAAQAKKRGGGTDGEEGSSEDPTGRALLKNILPDGFAKNLGFKKPAPPQKEDEQS